MGFEQPGGKPFRIPVSDTQAYRQFGNSVVVPVFEAVAKLLQPYIMKAAASKVTKNNITDPPEFIRGKQNQIISSAYNDLVSSINVSNEIRYSRIAFGYLS